MKNEHTSDNITIEENPHRTPHRVNDWVPACSKGFLLELQGCPLK